MGDSARASLASTRYALAKCEGKRDRLVERDDLIMKGFGIVTGPR